MRADGKRTGVTEKFSSVGGVDAAFATNDFSWEYDAAGRLISETADASGGSLFNDYSETFVYDLTGNRVKQTKVSDNSSGNGSTTETTDYVYDANDRLLIETRTVGSDEKTSVYTYNKTQQTEKETTEYEDGGLGEPVTITTTQTFGYDLQGKLSKSTTTKDGGQALGSDGNSSTVYEYDSAGNRIAATTTRQNTVGGSTTTRIEYLTDSENPTGYSQVLTETEFAVTVDANGNEVQTPIKEVVYTIGHDQISQTNLSQWNTTTENWELKTENYFGTDGHGSVRVLYDAVAAIVQGGGAQQLYHFDAYGNLLNFGAGTLNPNATPLTSYLYSGEVFDFNIGQQYLRARWYDPTTGRFNSLDPFAGNSSDPQSFHKYAYVHGDPIQGVDPSGKMLAGVATLGSAIGRTIYTWKLIGAGMFAFGSLSYLAYRANLFGVQDFYGYFPDRSHLEPAIRNVAREMLNVPITVIRIDGHGMNTPASQEEIEREFLQASRFWEDYGISIEIKQPILSLEEPNLADINASDVDDVVDRFSAQYGGLVIINVGNIDDPESPLGLRRGTNAITASSQNGFVIRGDGNEVTFAHEFAHVVAGLYHTDTISNNILNGSLGENNTRLSELYVSERQLEEARSNIIRRGLKR